MSFKVTVTLEGVNETSLKLKGAREIATKALARGLYVEGEKIMAESKGKYVPVKSGNLRSSGHVQPPKRVGDHGYVILLGYGGPSVPYALVQHEALHFKHPHGEAKYLEKPTLKAAPGMGKRVSRRVAAALKAAGKLRK